MKKKFKIILGIFVVVICVFTVKTLHAQEENTSESPSIQSGFMTTTFDNEAMSSDILYDEGPVTAGSYKIAISDFIEKEPDQIKSGDTITFGFDTCSNFTAIPNLTDSKALYDIQSGEQLGTLTAVGNSIVFTFNDSNNAKLITDGDMIISFDLDILTTQNSPDFSCGLNIDASFTGVNEQPIEEHYEDDITLSNRGIGSYNAIIWYLDDTYTNLGNVIKDSNGYNNRQSNYSAGYYESIGGQDHRGGIIADGSTTVGQTIGININHSGGDTYVTRYEFEDLQSYSGTYTLAHETSYNDDYELHVFMSPARESLAYNHQHEVTDLLEEDDFYYDEATNSIHYKVDKEDFAEAEAKYGYVLDDPEIFYTFAVDINYDEDSAEDNKIIGQPVDIYDYRYTFYDPSGAKYDPSLADIQVEDDRLDAIDGYANEGLATVNFVDVNQTRDGVGRNFYQEESGASGLVTEPYFPTTTEKISDSDEYKVELNTLDICTKDDKVTYTIDSSTTNLYPYYTNIGKFVTTINPNVTYTLDDVSIINNTSGEDITQKPYWTLSIVDNNLIVDINDYNVEYREEMLFNAFTITINATVDLNSTDFKSESYWEINSQKYYSNSVDTTLTPCDTPTEDEPTDDEPTTDEPTTDEPTTDEPTTDEPTTDEPATDESSTDETATDESSTDETATKEKASEAKAQIVATGNSYKQVLTFTLLAFIVLTYIIRKKYVVKSKDK